MSTLWSSRCKRPLADWMKSLLRSATKSAKAIVNEARRGLQSRINDDRSVARDARGRMMTGSAGRAAPKTVSTEDVAFDVDGTVDNSDLVLSTKGTFFQQDAQVDGSSLRLVFGDFDVQQEDDGSSRVMLRGKVEI